MRNVFEWAWVVVAFAIGGSVGCDGMATSDGEVAVTEAPYTLNAYDPPPGTKPGSVYHAASIDFESSADIDQFAADNACGTKEETPYCDVLDPAYAAARGKPFLEVCRTFSVCAPSAATPCWTSRPFAARSTAS